MSPFLLSVVLSLVSAAAYAGAAVIQERVAATTPEAADPASRASYAPYHRPGWWASVGLNGAGALLHVAALAFGPLSLVQPLGALTIVLALPIAAIFVRKHIAGAAWRGALLTTGGLGLLLALTDGSASGEASAAARGVLAAVTIGGVAALVVAARRMRRPAARSLTLAVASGAAFGMASVFTKAVTDDWTDPLSLAMVAVLAPAGLLLSQAAYRGAGLSAPLATLTVVNPVIAGAVGIVAFGESFRFGAAGAVLALVAAAITAAGLVVLTAQAPSPAAEPDPAAAAVPAQRGTQPAATCARGLGVSGLAHARPRRDLRRHPHPADRMRGEYRQRRRGPERVEPVLEPVRVEPLVEPVRQLVPGRRRLELEPAAAAGAGPPDAAA
ncbi:DMT family transporter [Streptomyces coryli]|uniref:DMT family transporter n=1 Tax=Streptomyces coryli TaxID=1128680 RepID=UPI0019CFE788|nr:DMT family transporter [Streptomyces coryli]